MDAPSQVSSGSQPGSGSRTEAVADGIRARIAARQLAPGSRIPSVRAFAQAMSVSKSTVVEAYERLAAEGAIVARPGSGFYVAGKTRPLVLKAMGPELDRAVDPMWLSRLQQTGSGLMQPGAGLLPGDWLPDASVRRGLRAVARTEAAVLTQYDSPYGYGPLRALIALRVAEKGVQAEPDQIVLVDSATQALDLICRFLLQPGDTVLVDDPCYYNFLSLLRAHRVAVVGVPMTPAGPDLAALATLLAEHHPRFYLTNSALQNPTGTSLAPATAHRVLKLCEAHDTLIVEDEIFGDLEPEPAPRLAGFDGLDRVIQIGGFSKTLTAAMRCGWIALRPDWVEPLVDLKLSLSLGNGHVAAALAHGLLTDGTYRRALAETRRRVAGAMTRAVRDLRACGLELWAQPRGGYFLWMRLPDGGDAAEVARRALPRGMVLAPGVVFSPSGGWTDFLRFNVAHCAEPRVMATLREVL
ncbi:PLP-dependent aminotransferase family protein [Methylobacterium sp. NEAU 140]|uniref:aminotransferase-like domain-containing protein n=1 Tax=Methylobacterium sp. NEAU 140 TaxID=3064945 RepID=UPI0027326D7F|nr:PLP-dependent aminotransferase family protein [Methylobacterium sp. NEAU 140]MDP4025302.1 PLP-dependent aminotransferase family protein [Methylobacterium sp. NEAU 140]